MQPIDLQKFRRTLDRALQLDSVALMSISGPIDNGICGPDVDPRLKSFFDDYADEYYDELLFSIDKKEGVSISRERKNVDCQPNICEILDGVKKGEEGQEKLFSIVSFERNDDNPVLRLTPYYELKAQIDKVWRLAQKEAERKVKEEAERKAKEEAERKAKEEAERKAKEEAERKAKEEAERKAREEAMRKAVEENKRRKQLEAEQKAREEAEREAQENILVKQIQGIAEKEVAELRASFIHVKGGTFLSYLVRDKGIRTVCDFRISSMPLPKLLIDCIKSNGCKNWLCSDKNLFLERLGKLLGFKVMFPTIEQMEYAVRGGTELNPTHCCKSDRYLPKEENRLFATPPNIIEVSGTLYLNNERYKTLGCSSVKYPENYHESYYGYVHICCLPEAFEAGRKAAEEAERKAKKEAERKAVEELKCKAQEEAKRKAREENERKAKEEMERKANKEAELKAETESVTDSRASLIESFVSDTKDCEYKDGLIFGKKKIIKYVTTPITRHIWNVVVKKTTESDFNDDEYVAQKELGDFLKDLNAHFDGRIVFEYLHKNIHANVHLQVYEKLDKNACFVYIKEDNR